MSFSIVWTKGARADYDQLEAAAAGALAKRQAGKKKKSSRQEGTFKQVRKAIGFLPNPKHRGLQTHEYDGLDNPYDKKKKVFEAYAQNKTPGAYRVFWCYGPGEGEITLIRITPHP